jgi:hypothetical protein
MANLTQPETPVKPKKERKKPPRFLSLLVKPDGQSPGVLRIVEGAKKLKVSLYRLTVIPAGDAAEGPPAFNLQKFSDADPTGTLKDYDVLLPDADGKSGSCECDGHLAHGHKTRCKHIAALLKLLELRKL